MGQIALWILFFALIVIALYGSFVSRFPSSFLTLAAVFIAKFCMNVGEYISWVNISIIVILVIASMIVNKMAPRWAKSIAEYGKGGRWGTTVGSLIALLLAVGFAQMHSEALAFILILLTLVILPFLFAWLFEYISQKQMVPALQSAGAATVVYIATTFVKLFTVIYAVVLVFTNN